MTTDDADRAHAALRQAFPLARVDYFGDMARVAAFFDNGTEIVLERKVQSKLWEAWARADGKEIVITDVVRCDGETPEHCLRYLRLRVAALHDRTSRALLAFDQPVTTTVAVDVQVPPC